MCLVTKSVRSEVFCVSSGDSQVKKTRSFPAQVVTVSVAEPYLSLFLLPICHSEIIISGKLREVGHRYHPIFWKFMGS